MLEVAQSTSTVVDTQVATAVSQLMSLGLQAVLLALTTAITWGVKLGLNSMKSAWKRTIAARLVRFAQQRITPNEEKRKYVAVKLHERFPKISEEEIEHLLEEAVVNLKRGLATV